MPFQFQKKTVIANFSQRLPFLSFRLLFPFSGPEISSILQARTELSALNNWKTKAHATCRSTRWVGVGKGELVIAFIHLSFLSWPWSHYIWILSWEHKLGIHPVWDTGQLQGTIHTHIQTHHAILLLFCF